MLSKGGGSNRLPGLVTKQQAVEFPQVLTSNYIIIHWCRNDFEVALLSMRQGVGMTKKRLIFLYKNTLTINTIED